MDYAVGVSVTDKATGPTMTLKADADLVEGDQELVDLIERLSVSLIAQLHTDEAE